MPDQPRPLKYMWVLSKHKMKFHRLRVYLGAHTAILDLANYPPCGRHLQKLAMVTADTPDEKDCCKKCYAKMESDV